MRIRTRRARPRARTVSPKHLTRAVMREYATLLGPVDETSERPRTRGECAGGERPCPFVSCRHHLYLDVNPETGSIKINFPDQDPDELEQTCSLDVAEGGGETLDVVGRLLNITRERTRQIETMGLRWARRATPGDQEPAHELPVRTRRGAITQDVAKAMIKLDGWATVEEIAAAMRIDNTLKNRRAVSSCLTALRLAGVVEREAELVSGPPARGRQRYRMAGREAAIAAARIGATA